MRMPRIRLWLLLLLLSSVQSVTADVYRWEDENGRVHFGDRPPASETAEATTVETQNSPASSPASAPSASDREVTRQRLLDQYQKERDARKEAAQRKREEEERRAFQCARARDQLRSYQTHPVLYELLPNGERRFLSDAERERTLAEAEQAVAHWCD